MAVMLCSCCLLFNGCQGELKHIKDLRFWGPADVLKSKYSMDPDTAAMIESFLLPCLALNPGASRVDSANGIHCRVCMRCCALAVDVFRFCESPQPLW